MWALYMAVAAGVWGMDAVEGTSRTWSGGQAGVDLNHTELEIYAVMDDEGGWMTHFCTYDRVYV